VEGLFLVLFLCSKYYSPASIWWSFVSIPSTVCLKMVFAASMCWPGALPVLFYSDVTGCAVITWACDCTLLHSFPQAGTWYVTHMQGPGLVKS
jgi:hypothetical protein